MPSKRKTIFDPLAFLATAGAGRTVAAFPKAGVIFSQGETADAVFYIQKGKIKLTVVSEQGKEAVVAVLGVGEFCGEGCLAGQSRRIATASAMTECEIMRLEKSAMLRVLHAEPRFSEMFVSYLLTRTIKVEEDLVDQLFNSSEKRLARAASAAGEFRQGRPARADHRKSQPGDAGRDDRHHPLARELLHEQIPQARLHYL